MSQDAKEVSYLDKLKQQHAGYNRQHEKARAAVLQLEGAIIALDNLIKQLEKEQAEKQPEEGAENGGVDDQQAQ